MARLRRAIRDPAYAITGVADLVRHLRRGGLEAVAEALSGSGTDPDVYAAWLSRYGGVTKADRESAERLARAALDPPRLAVIVAPPDDPADGLGTGHTAAQRSVASLGAQLYRFWEAQVPAGVRTSIEDPRISYLPGPPDRPFSAGDLAAALARVAAGHVAVIQAGDVLSPTALLRAAELLRLDPAAALIYSDEDRLDASGRHREPQFKPTFDMELYRTVDYLGRGVVVPTGALRTALEPELGDEAWPDAMFKIVENAAPGSVHHIPEVLFHRGGAGPGARLVALKRHLARQSESGQIVGHPVLREALRIIYSLPEPAPPVTLVMPMGGATPVVATSLAALARTTAYPNARVVAIDNSAGDPDVRQLLESLGSSLPLSVLHDDSPFNFAHLANVGVEAADTELVVLINSDVAPLRPDWLDELVRFGLRPNVGSVGARLLYPDGRVQHAGIILGIAGSAGHAHKGLGPEASGHMGRAQLPQAVSAVTAACMLVRREAYLSVGGMDATRFPVAFNDVDLCLRLGDAGYRILFTPYAELVHHESASRGLDTRGGAGERFRLERDTLRRVWGHRLDDDPHYNVNLTLEREDFALAWPPRTREHFVPVLGPRAVSS